ncbi:hypothetical protein DMC30DRAFT_117089 [Rhodotorula diobovata]|uniref:Uncharacterized protein n=1 Tax=Rhodotorula diobovata TaxID=5288 RepID=A0A5C5G126_9BASI|nr:hypothetical protein DMC30DRAFT_117089 [Rhodotorula diobovata]
MAQPPPLPAAPPFPAFDWLVPGRGSAAGHCPSQRGLAHAHHAQDCISAARVRASPAARISLAQAPAPLWWRRRCRGVSRAGAPAHVRARTRVRSAREKGAEPRDVARSMGKGGGQPGGRAPRPQLVRPSARARFCMSMHVPGSARRRFGRLRQSRHPEADARRRAPLSALLRPLRGAALAVDCLYNTRLCAIVAVRGRTAGLVAAPAQSLVSLSLKPLPQKRTSSERRARYGERY